MNIGKEVNGMRRRGRGEGGREEERKIVLDEYK
jgi:hypothetical protein